jgi:hypothetical protein
MRAAARAIEEAEQENAGAHASARRRIGDGDDLKGAAEFASPAQMRARERALRCFEKGSGPAPHAVYESSRATINRTAIESVSPALPNHVRV